MAQGVHAGIQNTSAGRQQGRREGLTDRVGHRIGHRVGHKLGHSESMPVSGTCGRDGSRIEGKD